MRITNELLEQYLENEEKIRELVEQNNTIRIMLKEKGSLATKDYVVVVNEVAGQTRLPGKDILIKFFGEDLIKPLLITTEPYKTVVVKQKGVKAVVS